MAIDIRYPLTRPWLWLGMESEGERAKEEDNKESN